MQHPMTLYSGGEDDLMARGRLVTILRLQSMWKQYSKRKDSKKDLGYQLMVQHPMTLYSGGEDDLMARGRLVTILRLQSTWNQYSKRKGVKKIKREKKIYIFGFFYFMKIRNVGEKCLGSRNILK